MFVSKGSLQRFVRLYLSINETRHWFHQTLTFKGALNDSVTAKRKLKQLFDSVAKTVLRGLEWAAIYVEEFQQSKGIHYHVLLCVYERDLETPVDAMEDMLRRDLFRIWNRLNNNLLHRKANQLTLRCKSKDGIDYLLKYVDIADGKLSKATLWWGCRNRNVIRANSVPVSKESISEYVKPRLASLLRFKWGPLDIEKEEYGWRELRFERKNYWDIFCDSWEGFKAEEVERKTGVKKRLTDKEFIAFRKSYGF
jgi:hypothetical protein